MEIELLEDRLLLSNGVPVADHVVWVIEENHSFADIIGSTSAPYINSLANDPNGALFTRSFAVEHPSQPNYFDMFAGSNQGVTDDSTPANQPFTTDNLGAELLAKGNTFTSYAEDLPAAGYSGASSGLYARWHNPAVNWQGSGANGIPAADNQPFSSFPTGNYAALPTLSIVVPNLDDDMHDGTVSAGDTWLQSNLAGYVQWAKANNSLLILTFDEDDGSQSNQIPTIFVGQTVKGGSYSETIDHFNLLRTVEDMYGLAYAGAAGQSSPITDIWTTAAPPQTVGIFDPKNAVFHLSNAPANPGSGDIAFQYGGVGWDPLAGNFSGTGLSTPALFDPNNASFHISTVLGNPGSGDIAFEYGGVGWEPLAGNFFNTRTDTVGVFDPNNAVFHLSNLLANPGSKDYAFQYGGTGWIPLVGNFFGTGTDTIGIFDPNNAVFHLSNVRNNPGTHDYAFPYGGRGWIPFAGDFFGLGRDTVGVFDPNNGVFHLSNVLNNPGANDYAFQYGGNGWVPIAGDWDFPTLPQLAAGGEARIASGAAPLTNGQLQTEVQAALNLLAADGVNKALLAQLGSLQFSVGQLPTAYLGLSNLATRQMEISSDAAGYGWFVDTIPSDSVPANRMDLLTVVLHEMGHFDGWTELDPAMHPAALMALTLGTGQRRIDALDTVFAAGL